MYILNTEIDGTISNGFTSYYWPIYLSYQLKRLLFAEEKTMASNKPWNISGDAMNVNEINVWAKWWQADKYAITDMRHFVWAYTFYALTIMYM